MAYLPRPCPRRTWDRELTHPLSTQLTEEKKAPAPGLPRPRELLGAEQGECKV